MSRAGGSSTRAPRMAWSRRSSTIATSRRAIWARGGSCADEGARRSRAAGARSRGTVLRAAGPLGAAPPGNRRERARLAGPARRRPAAGRGGQAPDRARSQSHPRRVSGKAPRRRCQRAGLRARRRARGGGSARADRFHRYGARARFAGGGGDAARPPASAHLPAARRHAHALRAWRRLGQRHRRLGRRRPLGPRSAGRDRAVRGGRGGAPVARGAQDLLRRAEPVRHVQMGCHARFIAVPPPQASPAVPWLLRRAFANAIALVREPTVIETRIRVGPLTLVGVPGEPVGGIGRQMAPEVIVGLADGYAGYVEMPERWAAGEGESQRTWFGPGLAQLLGLWSGR